jgi:hypothetical protein
MTELNKLKELLNEILTATKQIMLIYKLGDSDLINYYDKIRSAQKIILKPELQKLVNYINIVLGKKINKGNTY